MASARASMPKYLLTNKAEQLKNTANPSTAQARGNSFTDTDGDNSAPSNASMFQTPPPFARLPEVAVDIRIVEKNALPCSYEP